MILLLTVKTQQLFVSKEEIIKQIPQIKLHNYAFHNNGNLTFTNETNNWGLSTPHFPMALLMQILIMMALWIWL